MCSCGTDRLREAFSVAISIRVNGRLVGRDLKMQTCPETPRDGDSGGHRGDSPLLLCHAHPCWPDTPSPLDDKQNLWVRPERSLEPPRPQQAAAARLACQPCGRGSRGSRPGDNPWDPPRRPRWALPRGEDGPELLWSPTCWGAVPRPDSGETSQLPARLHEAASTSSSVLISNSVFNRNLKVHYGMWIN